MFVDVIYNNLRRDSVVGVGVGVGVVGIERVEGSFRTYSHDQQCDYEKNYLR